MSKRIALLFICLLPFVGMSQEFNAQVEVIHPQIQTTVEEIFESLEQSMENFLNNTKFSDVAYQSEEKIELSLVLNVTSMADMKFQGNLQIAVTRPVYDTDYLSQMLRIKDDDITFTYRQYEAVEYVEGSSTNNLSNIMAFYAFYALGVDYDSFTKLGGTTYYNKALNIANAAQSSGEPGWSSTAKGRDNRYFLVFQTLDERFKEMRLTNYTYHRKGLDLMTQDSETARSTILTSLQNLKKVHQNSPNSHLLQVFLESKRQEIINIFTKATTTEKKALYDLVQILDVANLSKYKTQLEN